MIRGLTHGNHPFSYGSDHYRLPCWIAPCADRREPVQTGVLSEELFDKLRGVKRLMPFTASEGADRHCEPMARSLLEQRMFDWLDETLPAATSWK